MSTVTLNLTLTGEGTPQTPWNLAISAADPTILVIKPGVTLQLTFNLTSSATNVSNVGLYPNNTTFQFPGETPSQIEYQDVTGPVSSVWANITNPLTASAVTGGDANGILLLLQPAVWFDDAQGNSQSVATQTAVSLYVPVVHNLVAVESNLQFSYAATGSRASKFTETTGTGTCRFTIKNQQSLSVLFELGRVPLDTVFDSGSSTYSPTWWYNPSNAYSSVPVPTGYSVSRINDSLFHLTGTNANTGRTATNRKFRIVLMNTDTNDKTLIVAPDPTIVEEGISTY